MADDVGRRLIVERVGTDSEPVWHGSEPPAANANHERLPQDTPQRPSAEWPTVSIFLMALLVVWVFRNAGPNDVATLLALGGGILLLVFVVVGFRALLVWFLRPFVEMIKR